MDLIEIKDLSVSYKIGYKNIKILDNLKLNIKKGEYVCIVGSNGSGKSTLLKAILGLVPYSSGLISINCKKSKISYLPQNSDILIDFPATVSEIILSGTQNTESIFPFYKKRDKLLADDAIKRAGVDSLVKRRFGELSGGQQQRVLFARAICKKPEILILDEPCTGLDPEISNSFYALLNKLNKETHTTILMVSHDIDSVKKYATKVIEINKKIMFYGTTREWLKMKTDG